MPWKKCSRTEIVHIVVTGYQKKKSPNKYYVFVIDVTWNNSERFEVYRRYSDFFSFQTTLKALFPGPAGKRINEERVIPQLPKRIFVGRSHVAKVAEARLEQINRYCQTLISLDPRVSESAHVVGFFSPRIGDKQLPKLHLHRPASLHPEKIPLGNVFEEYCALAEYVAEDGSQVSFRSGEKVLVMSKDKSGWWMCGVDGRVGWAPPSYLKKYGDKTENESDESDDDMPAFQRDKDSDDSGMGDNSASEPNTPASSIDSTKNFISPEIKVEAYQAIDSYQSDGPGQVSFEIGDTIHVLDKLEDGWWFVSNGKDQGWAPCSYLEGDKEEEEAMSSLEDAQKYYSVDNYEAEEDDEISFNRGVIVDVLQKSLDGWWLVKIDKLVGLAPATFLKKVESQMADTPQGLGRKVTPPTSPTASLSPFRTFQQPPRKQSVRAKASMRNRPAKQTDILPPIPAERPFIPLTKPAKKLSQKSISLEATRRKIPNHSSEEQSVSPELSDSDPEDNYCNHNAFHLAVDASLLKRASSVSSSAPSEDGSVTSKPPVATPRRNKSQTRSKTITGTSSAPPLPPRPAGDPSCPPLPPRPSSIKKHHSFTEVHPTHSDEPARPKQRPRMSEIKRAKERSRGAKPQSPTSPSLTVVDEDGLETRSTRSSKSTKSYASTKSAPGLNDIHKKRKSTTGGQEFDPTRLVVPGHRQRRRSADDGSYNDADPSGTNDGELLPDGGMNTQVADTLLKYIISSEDPGLKAALRELITQDSKVIDSIQDD